MTSGILTIPFLIQLSELAAPESLRRRRISFRANVRGLRRDSSFLRMTRRSWLRMTHFWLAELVRGCSGQLRSLGGDSGEQRVVALGERGNAFLFELCGDRVDVDPSRRQILHRLGGAGEVP